jgi:RecA-family ATPase
MNDDVQYAPVGSPLHGEGIESKKVVHFAPPRPNGAAEKTSSATNPLTWRDHTFTAASLYGRTFPEIKYVVSDLVPEGLTILAGRPKVGKSWAALDIAIAVASDGYCFGDRKALHGDVLYCALEDNPRRLKRRIRKIMQARGMPWPARLTLATRWRRLDDGGVRDAQEWAASVERPVLVIFDTLAGVRPDRKSQDTLYDGDYRALTSLHAWANEQGIAVVVLHHTRKMDADDPLDTVSGSLGLTGCADTTLVLQRSSQGTTLYLRGRDIEEAEHAVVFNAQTCRWAIIGDAAEVRRSDSRQSVLTVLREASEVLTSSDIMAECQMRRDQVDQLMARMVRDGEILKVSRGRFVHPDRSDLIPAGVPSEPSERQK